jgi:predicted RNA-binding protein YlqC (UPF0109 family)
MPFSPPCQSHITEAGAPVPLTIRLCIHKSQAGAIIGKQGATIRQLKEVWLMSDATRDKAHARRDFFSFSCTG